MSMLFQNYKKQLRKISSMSSMAKQKDSRSCFITRWCVSYKCVQLVQGEIILISITIILPFILKKTSHTSFCFFDISKLVSPQYLLFTLFCFREKNGEKNPATNLNKFCSHAVAGFATHCANRHGALHPRSKVWSSTTPLYQNISI